jgi:hypothetical protein
MDYLLEFGLNSTVISLHDNNTEILEDTSTFNNSWLNMRNSTSVETGNTEYSEGIRNTWLWMKFNMSRIYSYSNYTLVSAVLSLYHEDNEGTDFHSGKTYSIYGISNQTWTDLVCTDQLKNCPALSSTITTGITPSGSEADYYWQNFDVTSWVQNQKTAENKNISFMINRTFDPALEDYCRFDSKEEPYPQYRPYLNITLDDGSQQVDLEIVNIRPIQVVYGVDMVLNKSGYVLVDVRNNGNISVNATVIVYFDNYRLNSYTIFKQINPNQINTFEFYFTFNLTGLRKINASVSIYDE